MYDIPQVDAFEKGTSVDFNRQGQFARAGMTALVRQALVPTLAWADFTATFANGSFVLNVSDGFLYKEGAQHKTEAPTPINLVNDAPPSPGLKRIISIVAYALPAQPVAPENREFATQVTPASGNVPATYQQETRTTNTVNRQIARVARYAGDVAPQPTPPTLAADLCEVARVVLGQGGIESVTFVEANRITNLTGERARLDGVIEFVDGVGVRVDTIDKNLAALAARSAPVLSDATLRQILRTLSTVSQATKIKTGDLSFGIDYGLDLRASDNTYAGYQAAVEDGIRFPWVSSKETPLSLYTPGDPVTKVISGLLLPDFDEETRLNVEGMDGTLSISNQVNSTVTAVQVTIPRSAVRTGEPFTTCVNQQWWQEGSYDPVTQIFTRAGEAYQVQSITDVGFGRGHEWVRLYKVWTDTWTETRWDVITTQIGLNGAIRGQTFRVPDFGYLTSLELPFTTIDPAYGVTLLLCEATTSGTPNLNRVLERCDLAANAIVADAAGKVRTKFAFRPAFVKPGKLYAWVTVTRGNYALATVKGNKFAEGTSFLTTDNGGFFQGDPVIDFAFNANFARFKSPRVEVRLNDIDNTNGDVISALKFLYGSVIPDGTRIVHMAKKSGGDWQSVGEVTKASTQTPLPTLGVGPFSSTPLPVSVQHKLVFVGTTTLMPAVDLTQAWVTALKLGAARYHVSTVLNFGTSCNRAEVQVTVDGPFDPVNHSTLCKLLVGGTLVDPSATSFVDDASKPGQRTYTYAFTFTTATSARIVLPGALTSILSTFHVESRFFRAWLV